MTFRRCFYALFLSALFALSQPAPASAGVVTWAWQGMFGPPGSMAYYRAARVNSRQGIYPQPFGATYAAGYTPYSAGYAPYSAGYSPMSSLYSPYSVGYAPDYGMTSAYYPSTSFYGGFESPAYASAGCCSPCNSCSTGDCSSGTCAGGNCGGAASQTYRKPDLADQPSPDPAFPSNNDPNSQYNNNPSGNPSNSGTDFQPPNQGNIPGSMNNPGDAPTYQPPTNNAQPAPDTFNWEKTGAQHQPLPPLLNSDLVAKVSWEQPIAPTRIAKQARFNLPLVARSSSQPRIFVPAPSEIQIAGK